LKRTFILIRKLVFQRILLLCLLYCLVFFIIVIVKFSGQDGFVATVIPMVKGFDPEDYTISEARTGTDFDARVAL
jgi:hypothetical protein